VDLKNLDVINFSKKLKHYQLLVVKRVLIDLISHFFHLVKEMYGEKVGQKWMSNEFKMATVEDGGNRRE